MAGGLAPLYDVEWQKYRVSFLAAHHAHGGFTTAVGTNDNIQRLNNYIFAVPQDTDEFKLRVWRGLNLLNATRMGFSGMGLEGSQMDRAVREYRDTLAPLHEGRVVVNASNGWDWAKVEQDLHVLYRNEPYWFKAIWDDLQRRKKQGIKRQGSLENRSELARFLLLMDRVRMS